MKPGSRQATVARMFMAQLLLFAVGIAAIIVAIVVAGVPEMLQMAVMFGSSLSLSGLIGLWSGFSSAAVYWRCMTAAFGGAILCSALALSLDSVFPYPGLDIEWIVGVVFTAVPLFAIGALGAVLKWRGYAVECLGDADDAAHRRGMQFSLRRLFVIVLLAAVLFAIVRGLRGTPRAPEPAFWEVCLVGSFNALVFVMHTQVVLWAALGEGRSLVRLVAVILSTAFAGAIYGFAVGGAENDYSISFVMVAVYSTLAAGSLSVLRRFGYRLTRRAAER